MNKIMQRAVQLLTALIGAAIFTAPVLLGALWDSVPFPEFILAAWALVGARQYWNTYEAAYTKLKARREFMEYMAEVRGLAGAKHLDDDSLAQSLKKSYDIGGHHGDR